MKKGMRLLAVLSATVLLISGCGTAMYELTEDEETLITQYAAYAVGKHNIRQKDGMTSDKPQEEDTTKREQKPQEDSKEPQDTQAASESGGEQGSGEDLSNYPEVSLTDALGCDTSLKITYKGYEVSDAYKEGNYFSVNAGGGNTLLIMKFTIVNSGKKAVKCLGIENFWGNIYTWVDGITTDSSRRLCVCHIPGSFSDSTSGTNIKVIASGVSSDISNYLSKVQGSTDGGFVAKEVSGSDSTYFCDYANLDASYVACFGGDWYNGASAGAFSLRVNSSASNADSTIGSRLMYV